MYLTNIQYRIVKNLVLQHVDLTTTTVGALKQMAVEGMHSAVNSSLDTDSTTEIKVRPGWKVYKALQPDTLKLYTRAHGSKTTNLIINLDHEDWVLTDETAILQTLGIENETELSFFRRGDYDAFKADPTEKWL